MQVLPLLLGFATATYRLKPYTRRFEVQLLSLANLAQTEFQTAGKLHVGVSNAMNVVIKPRSNECVALAFAIPIENIG